MAYIAKNKAVIILLFIILSLSVAGWYASKLPLESTSKDFAITVLNGFWTALFAFIFLGLSSIASKVFGRELKHYNSLVNLETQLNEMIGVIKDNIYVMKGYKTVILKGNIHWGNLRPIFIDKSHYENLHDINLINRVFSFFYQVRKINDDMENLQAGYNDLKNAYIQKQIRVEQYVENARRICEVLDDLEDFSEELFDELLSLLTRVQIQIRKEKPLTAIINEALIYTTGDKITLSEFETAKKRIKSELETSAKESAEQIAKIHKRRKK